MALSRTKSTRTAKAAPSRNTGGTLQAAKAAQTRSRLIEATIRCLVKYGYANTTTPRVAQEAGLSRGAMMHHFENGAALIKATIIELHERRLRAFRRAAEKPEHDVDNLTETYWAQVQKPGFIAFHELAVAARTDKELSDILVPLQEEFRDRFNDQAQALFPEWRSSPEKFDLAMNLSQTILEGMSIAVQTGAMSSEKVPAMLHHLENQIRELMPREQS
ncbi:MULTISPECIES: TetR/AcrR family transcriptional regulator [Novosphingobium]|uniref:Transcriptional regulator, TetR family n=1 Tax=Novosphingobium mathurense TaxID=428990 RepID=A0A1U6HVG1_9SPHN|nr:MULTISPECIES: TetR/AcrR family transcriptional regulator [Novosphingobium]CDO35182.1 Transcriptional regulator, TetR family [Novosphingobium sp. KN65.2]SLJ99807.1 transcriptional regulator, TetR family [Novosphingobium mathurense]